MNMAPGLATQSGSTWEGFVHSITIMPSMRVFGTTEWLVARESSARMATIVISLELTHCQKLASVICTDPL